MNPDTDVRERLHRAIDPIEPATEEALTMVGGTVARRHQRRRIGAIAVAVAIVGALAFAGWRAVAPGESVPLVDPSPSVTPIDEAIEITPPPPGVEPKLTYQEIEDYVFAQIARDEDDLGTRLADPRIISITYVEANEKYPFENGAFREHYPTWVVAYDGTVMVCGSWCSGHPGATIQFRDARDPERFGEASHMQDMVCVARDRFSDGFPKSTDRYPDC
jgi:hypothetical protein